MKAVKNLHRRLMQLMRMAKLIKVDDAQPIQRVQLELLDGQIIEVPRVQDYGISSVPLPGAKGVSVAVGGRENGYICIKLDDYRYRQVSLKPGEVCLYDHQAQVVHLKQNGHIQVTANTQATVTAPLVRIEGDLQVTGDIIDHVDTTGQSMAGMRTTYNGHTHQGDSGGSTGNPNQSMGA